MKVTKNRQKLIFNQPISQLQHICINASHENVQAYQKYSTEE